MTRCRSSLDQWSAWRRDRKDFGVRNLSGLQIYTQRRFPPSGVTALTAEPTWLVEGPQIKERQNRRPQRRPRRAC